MADENIKAQILANLEAKSFFIHYLLSDDGVVYVAGYVGMGEWVALSADAAIQEAIEALLQNGQVKVTDQIESYWLEIGIEPERLRHTMQTARPVTGRRLLAVTWLES